MSAQCWWIKISQTLKVKEMEVIIHSNRLSIRSPRVVFGLCFVVACCWKGRRCRLYFNLHHICAVVPKKAIPGSHWMVRWEREQCVLCWRMLSDGRSNYLRLPKDKAKGFGTGTPTTTWEWQQLLIKRDVDGAFAAPADLKEEDLNLIQDWDRRWWRGPPRDEQQLLK